MEEIMIISIISKIFWALVILIVGSLFAKKGKELVQNFLENIRLNQATKNLGWHHFFERYNAKLNASGFFGLVTQVYLFLITLMISVEILDLKGLGEFILTIVTYYPNIFISSAIFILAVFIAEFSQKIVFPSEDLKYSNNLSDILSFAVWVLAALAILYQLQIVPDLIMTLFIGVVAAFALSFGIAVGLGGQDFVKSHLKKFGKKIK